MLRTAALTLLSIALGSCGTLHRGARSLDQPDRVHELIETAADGTRTNAFPQYWVRNTLVVDLQSAAPSGRFFLKPRRGHGWPMRVAFRVRPGAMELIEVQAAQRMVIPVTRDGSNPIDIELAPGVYDAKTTQMAVTWQR